MTEFVVLGGMAIFGEFEAAAAKSACITKASARAQPGTILPKTAMTTSCSIRREAMFFSQAPYVYVGLQERQNQCLGVHTDVIPIG